LHQITRASRKKGKKRKKKEKRQNKKEKETGAPVVEHLVDRNYYFFGFYNVQYYAIDEYS
jgi:hypothetical protein